MRNSIFENKVAWITGASSGIGEALVYEFVRMGARVIASSNDLTGLVRVKEACGSKSVMVNCVPFDLSDMSEIERITSAQYWWY
jgi:dehydrogenase/reductase SDR family protein 7B